jgi:hypothetical protein
VCSIQLFFGHKVVMSVLKVVMSVHEVVMIL